MGQCRPTAARLLPQHNPKFVVLSMALFVLAAFLSRDFTDDESAKGLGHLVHVDDGIGENMLPDERPATVHTVWFTVPKPVKQPWATGASIQ